MTRRTSVFWIAHGVAVAAVLVALSPWGRDRGRRGRVVVAFDASASVVEVGAGPRDVADAFATRFRPLDPSTVVDGLVFGATAAPWFSGAAPDTVAASMRTALPPVDGWGSSPADALAAASAGGGPATVVLVTDGSGVDDACVAAARGLRAGGHVVHVAPVHVARPMARPFLADVRAPLRVAPGAPIRLEVTVAARGASATEAVVAVRESGGAEQRRRVAVPARGAISAIVRFDGGAMRGVRRFEVALDGGPADAARRASVEVAVGDALSIGVLGRVPEWAAALGDGFAIRRVDAADAAVDVLVVHGLVAGPPPLDARGAAALADAVRDGTGLLAVAGSVGFGPGGWRESPLATILPVRIERAGPDADVSVLVDRSGSMAAADRWPSAVRGVVAVVAGLGSRDRVRVATFARDVAEAIAWRAVPGAAGAIRNALGAVRPGGPTNLAAAVDAVRFPPDEEPARRRLLIVSSDGRLGGGPARYRALGHALRERGVRVGVVQSGGDAPAAGLRALTLDGANGRVVLADGDDLERAFRAAADDGWWIDPVPPVRAVAAPTPPAGGWPQPQRVSRTRLAPAGRLVADAGDAPLVAIGRHGLGRVAVAAFDAGETAWAGPEPWRTLLPGVFGDERPRGVRGRVDVRGGRAVASLRVPEERAVATWTLRWGSRRIPFDPIGPGRLRTASFSPPPGGATAPPAFAEFGDRRVRIGVAVVHGAELAVDDRDTTRHARLATAGGGRVLGPGDTIPAPMAPSRAPAWPWAALALVAFLVGRAVKFAPIGGR